MTMRISKKDREEYKEGPRDRRGNIFEQAFADRTMNDADSEAYYRTEEASGWTRTKRTRSVVRVWSHMGIPCL